MTRNWKGVVRILDKIIDETSTDNMDLTTINQMQYIAALLITNTITPPKLATNRKPRGGPPAWQQRLHKQIDQLRRHINHHWIHQWKHHQQYKEETQDHSQETQDNSRWTAHSLQRGSKAGTTSHSTKNKKIYQKKWAVQKE